MSDTQEAVEDSKIFLRFQNIWKAGEKFPVCYVPTVEGMVVAARWMENVLMVIFLSPPYMKAVGTWAEASLMYKSAASLVRQTLSSYDFPFPADPRIVEEVKKVKGNVEMLQELVKFLNKQCPPPPQSQNTKVTTSPWDSDDQENNSAERETDRLSVYLLLSQQDDDDKVDRVPMNDKILGKLAKEVSRRLSLDQEKAKQKKAAKKQEKKKKKKASPIKSSSSPLSSSSSSASEPSSSSEEENVGVEQTDEEEGWFVCLFSVEDIRRTAEPRQRMKGTVEERKFLRQALHNIYSEYCILKAFVETVRSESLSSPSKPFNSDIIWLSFHATYLDILFLHDSTGPWKPWNELVLDHLAKSFLELLVRSSTNRSYPDILDERVCKWMKRKRVGLSTHFGAIPGFLANAKITESGIHPKGGWEVRNFNKNSSSSSSQFRVKPQGSQNAGLDKKG